MFFSQGFFDLLCGFPQSGFWACWFFFGLSVTLVDFIPLEFAVDSGLAALSLVAIPYISHLVYGPPYLGFWDLPESFRTFPAQHWLTAASTIPISSAKILPMNKTFTLCSTVTSLL